MIVSLRCAVAEDAPSLARVHVAAWHEAYRAIVPAAYLQGLTIERRAERYRQSLEAGTEETYVVERGGEILGLLTLGSCRDSDVDQETTGEIWRIYLSPEHWRKGIGTCVAKQAESMLASRGYTMATLWVLESNNHARRFYEAMGFEADGSIKQLEIGIALTAIRYRKTLK